MTKDMMDEKTRTKKVSNFDYIPLIFLQNWRKSIDFEICYVDGNDLLNKDSISMCILRNNDMCFISPKLHWQSTNLCIADWFVSFNSDELLNYTDSKYSPNLRLQMAQKEYSQPKLKIMLLVNPLRFIDMKTTKN